MDKVKMPGWSRGLEIITGLILIILALAILFYPGLAILILVLVLAITLLFAGISMVVFGVMKMNVPKVLRAGSVVIGLAAILLSLMFIVAPIVSAEVLIVLFAFVLLLGGILRTAHGWTAKTLDKNARGFVVAAGILVIIISLVVLLMPALGLLVLVYLLAIALLIHGIGDIVSGMIGV